MAYESYTDISLNGNKVIGLADGDTPDAAVNKGQLDASLATIDLSGYTTDAEHTQEITDRTSGDTALGARLDAINIIGDGLVTAVESGDNTWTLNIDSIPIANTYTGPGTDSATIEADLVAQGVVSEVGDMYVNNTTGSGFLCTVAVTTWKELAAAGGGIQSVSGTAGEILVTNPAGPTATVGLETAFKDRVAALEAVKHGAATGVNAIAVDAAQAISLVLDPAGSPALSQSAAGLKLDPSALSTVKKFSGPVNLSGATTATVAHNLNTVDVVVQTSVATGRVGLDVAVVDANNITVSAKAANAALAAVTVVVFG